MFLFSSPIAVDNPITYARVFINSHGLIVLRMVLELGIFSDCSK